MTKPTAEQIEAEIKKLTEMKPNVIRTSYFGENHHAAIDAQIKVLEAELDEDDIYERFPTEEDLEGRESEASEEDVVKANVRDGALEAAQWLAGEEDETPSDGWKELIKK